MGPGFMAVMASDPKPQPADSQLEIELPLSHAQLTREYTVGPSRAFAGFMLQLSTWFS